MVTKANTSKKPAVGARPQGRRLAAAAYEQSGKATFADARVGAAKPSQRATTSVARRVKSRTKTVMSDMTAAADAPDASAPAADRLIETATRNTLAINPLIGIRARDFGGAAQTLLGAAVKQPAKAARHLGAYARELGKASLGKSRFPSTRRTSASPAGKSPPPKFPYRLFTMAHWDSPRLHSRPPWHSGRRTSEPPNRSRYEEAHHEKQVRVGAGGR